MCGIAGIFSPAGKPVESGLLVKMTDSLRHRGPDDEGYVLSHTASASAQPFRGKETISAEGPTQLPEARRAIQSGKLPRKAGLIVSRQDQQYTFTLQAETLNVSSAVLPKVETNGDPRAYFEERVGQVRHLAETLDLLYGAFLKLRLSTDWPALSDRLRAWLRRS